LRSVNGIPARMLVKAGSTLLVPRQGKLNNDVTEHLADNGHLLLAPEVVLRKIMIKARSGDTLARLASRHGVSAANVADWNSIRPNAALTKGQSLAIYMPAKAARKASKASPHRAEPQRNKATTRGSKAAPKR
jgi:membrane-bound lytic murein transglycosylase D